MDRIDRRRGFECLSHESFLYGGIRVDDALLSMSLQSTLMRTERPRNLLSVIGCPISETPGAVVAHLRLKEFGDEIWGGAPRQGAHKSPLDAARPRRCQHALRYRGHR